MSENNIFLGDTVKAKCRAGLILADRPSNGEQKQFRKNACVLKGKGTVLEVHDYQIDYDTWDSLYKDIGIIWCRQCLVKCENGIGWASAGALIKV